MLNTKQCSCCKKFKSISEFYKQGQRHESLCKDCKKQSRKNRNKNENIDYSKRNNSEFKKSDPSEIKVSDHKNISDRIALPNYDESFFMFNETRDDLKISDDDMDLVVSFFRWHFEKSKKRNQNKEGVE